MGEWSFNSIIQHIFLSVFEIFHFSREASESSSNPDAAPPNPKTSTVYSDFFTTALVALTYPNECITSLVNRLATSAGLAGLHDERLAGLHYHGTSPSFSFAHFICNLTNIADAIPAA